MTETVVWTDGSSTGRWGVGGWAWCVLEGPYADWCDSGGDQHTTNQRMELTAAHQAVLSLPGPIVVTSDSEYVVRCFNDRWYEKWVAKDWRKVANTDLWQPFIRDVLARGEEVRFEWVRGHAGVEGNEQADQLAKAAKQEQARLLEAMA